MMQPFKSVFFNCVVLSIGCIASLAQAQTSLTIATVHNSDMIRMQALSENFTNDNPDIELNWITLEENVLRQRVTTDIATGAGQFDVVTIGTYEVPIWAERDWLVSLDDMPNDYNVEDILSAIRVGLSTGGTLYAAPFYGESSFTMYRTDLFEQAGLLPHDRRLYDALAPQDYLYTVIERNADRTQPQVIGSITDYRFTPDDPQALIDKMAQADTRIVSLEITEGGYCRDPVSGEFDADHPDIVHDLAHPDQPRGAFGFLVAALAQRHQQGLAPFTVLSCDNLQHNGAVARATLLAFAQLRDPKLAEWLDQKGAFPNSMVDRITPATSDEDRRQLKQQFGIDDAWLVDPA